MVTFLSTTSNEGPAAVLYEPYPVHSLQKLLRLAYIDFHSRIQPHLITFHLSAGVKRRRSSMKNQYLFSKLLPNEWMSRTTRNPKHETVSRLSFSLLNATMCECAFDPGNFFFCDVQEHPPTLGCHTTSKNSSKDFISYSHETYPALTDKTSYKSSGIWGRTRVQAITFLLAMVLLSVALALSSGAVLFPGFSTTSVVAGGEW